MEFLFQNTEGLLPIFSAAVPFLGFALVVGFAFVYTGRWGRAHISTYVWMAVFAALELFMTIWCAQSLCEASWLTLVIYSVLLMALGMLVFLREPMMRAQNKLILPKEVAEAPEVTTIALSSSGPIVGVQEEKLAEQRTDPLQVDAIAQMAQAEQNTTRFQKIREQQEASGTGNIAMPIEQEAPRLSRYEQGTFPRSILVTLLTLLRDALLLFGATVLAQNGLEVADNAFWLDLPEEYLRFDWMVIMMALSALYFLGQRRGILPALGVTSLVLFGIAESFLDRFKNTAILPSDLSALGTAAAVADGYTYLMNTTCLWAIIFGACALFLIAFITPPRAHKIPLPGRAIANVALAAALAFSLMGIFNSHNLQERFDFKLWYWDLRVNYQERSTLVAFLAAAQDLEITQPEGYSEDSARNLQTQLDTEYDASQGASETQQQVNAQFQQTHPNVVAIMNESYSDLSIFEELHAGYTGTPYLTGATDGMVQKGWTTVSVHGGNTCNSEFEFISGVSMGFIGYGKYPYLQYDFLNETTLPKQFKELGYTTTAIHPNYPGNWNRQAIYSNMGFDTSYFIYDFDENAPQFHSGITDGATYERIYEDLVANDQPQFFFDVTMANHGGYEQDNIPAGELTNYQPDFGDALITGQLNEYLSCIARSDAEIKAFLEKLAKLDEPTVVVFFGDHQPNITRMINDVLYEGEPELIHAARIDKTPYFIWANYDVAGAPGAQSPIDTSLNYLGADLLERIGAPLSDYQKAQLMLQQKLPLVNANGYYAANDTWYAYGEDSPASEAINQLNTIQYYNFAA